MVNGQTGKVSGESPVSAGKVVGLIAVIVAVIALIIILVRLAGRSGQALKIQSE